MVLSLIHIYRDSAGFPGQADHHAGAAVIHMDKGLLVRFKGLGVPVVHSQYFGRPFRSEPHLRALSEAGIVLCIQSADSQKQLIRCV